MLIQIRVRSFDFWTTRWSVVLPTFFPPLFLTPVTARLLRLLDFNLLEIQLLILQYVTIDKAVISDSSGENCAGYFRQNAFLDEPESEFLRLWFLRKNCSKLLRHGLFQIVYIFYFIQHIQNRTTHLSSIRRISGGTAPTSGFIMSQNFSSNDPWKRKKCLFPLQTLSQYKTNHLIAIIWLERTENLKKKKTKSDCDATVCFTRFSGLSPFWIEENMKEKMSRSVYWGGNEKGNANRLAKSWSISQLFLIN